MKNKELQEMVAFIELLEKLNEKQKEKLFYMLQGLLLF